MMKKFRFAASLRFSWTLLSAIALVVSQVRGGGPVQKPGFQVAIPQRGLSNDLSEVPEVDFYDSTMREWLRTPSQRLKFTDSLRRDVMQIHAANGKTTDGYMATLLDARSDLEGLPLTLGDACRMPPEKSRQFQAAMATLREMLGSPGQFGRQSDGGSRGDLAPPTASSPPGQPQFKQMATASHARFVQEFWERYSRRARSKHADSQSLSAQIRALMQMLGPESAEMREGLAKYLAGVQHVEATRALARLAIFSEEENVHKAAVDALKLRRERDYSDILLLGLRYPYPAVAKRTTDSMIQLERKDLIPELIAVLDTPDPRMPEPGDVAKGKSPSVRELVRINHLRNCLLCHAPLQEDEARQDLITGPIPVPSAPPTPAYYTNPSPPTTNQPPAFLVRADVTYIRQDFSVMLPVADPPPWPQKQRFDFVVRTRALSSKEAEAYVLALSTQRAGELSAYQRAVVSALRALSGRNTAPTAEAWRKLLELKPKG